jgi:hypothetical protein
MGFILKKLASGSRLESDGKGGNLGVISGKGKPASIKAWKDEGTIKKGDEIPGIELTIELSDRGNIVGQIYDQSTKKFLPDSAPISYPLKTTLFIPGTCGLAYLKVLADVTISQELELLKDTDTTPLIDGFKGVLLVSEHDLFNALVGGDYSKKNHIKMFIFDEFEPVDCKLDFAVATPYKGGGNSSQSEADRIKDRVIFVSSALIDGSDTEQMFVKAKKHDIDDKMNFIEFIALILG